MSLKNFAYSLMAMALCAAPLLAQDGGEGAAPAQAGPFGGNFLFIMIFMALIVYFIMIRPEQRRQKERVKMLSEIKKGDKVITIGGIYGVVQSVKDVNYVTRSGNNAKLELYVIKTGDGAVFEILKSAVQGLSPDEVAARGSDERKGQA